MGMSRSDNSVKNWKKFAHYQSQTRSPQYQCTYQVRWKSIDVYSSYHPETKIWACLRQITPSKIDEICPISNPKPDLHNINAYTKFGENPLMFTQVIIRKRKTDGRTYDRRTDGQTDGLTDNQRETIIPRHYCVVGYKNVAPDSQ